MASYVFIPEAEFLDVIGTKVLRVFLLFTVSYTNGFPPPPFEQKWAETGFYSNVNQLVEVTVNSKEENSYIKIFVSITSKNSASGVNSL